MKITTETIATLKAVELLLHKNKEALLKLEQNIKARIKLLGE